MAITATFYQRSLGLKIPLSVPVTVERYSWNMIGGPERAYLSIPAHADMWDLAKLLRCGVEIYGNDGRRNWWGYVNKITIPHGVQRLGIGLDNLFNYVLVDYDGGTTSAASNSISIAEFGQKEQYLFDSSATQAQGEQTRAIYLAEHEYARPELEFSGGKNNVEIECYGWFQTLDWKYYTDADTTNTEHTTQIASMITSAGQFLRGSIIEATAGITSTEERDGKRTAKAYIEQLLAAGTTNYRPLLALVDKDRFVHVYERDAEPVNQQTRFLMDRDGEIYTPLGLRELPEHCTCAAWVQVKDLPWVNRNATAVVPFFIEQAEYDAARDKTTFRAAGAYEQQRLAKYIKEKNNPPGSTEYPPVTPPAGGGVTDYAMIGFYQGSQVYSSSNGITLTDASTANFYEIQFTPSSSGVYIVGASIHHTEGGITNVYATTYVRGVADYDNQLLKFGGQSQSLTTDIYSSVSLTDYILSTQGVSVLGVLSNNTLADEFFMFAVKLT